LTTASNAAIKFINGGSGDTVYFQVGSSATLGSNTAFTGNILSAASITAASGASDLDGRLLASGGAVTLDTNIVTVSKAASTPEPGLFSLLSGLLFSGLGLLIAKRKQETNLHFSKPL